MSGASAYVRLWEVFEAIRDRFIARAQIPLIDDVQVSDAFFSAVARVEDAARAGSIKVYGTKEPRKADEEAVKVEIPLIAWDDYRINILGKAGTGPHDAEAYAEHEDWLRHREGPRWVDLRVRRADFPRLVRLCVDRQLALSIAPAETDAAPAAAESAKPITRAALAQFLQSRVAEATGERETTEKEDKLAATLFFGRTPPRSMLREVRKEAVPADWLRRGKRKRSSRSIAKSPT